MEGNRYGISITQSSDFPIFAIDTIYVVAAASSDGASEGSAVCSLPAAHRTPQADDTNGGRNGQSLEHETRLLR
jgi:hypothetical protein